MSVLGGLASFGIGKGIEGLFDGGGGSGRAPILAPKDYAGESFGSDENSFVSWALSQGYRPSTSGQRGGKVNYKKLIPPDGGKPVQIRTLYRQNKQGYFDSWKDNVISSFAPGSTSFESWLITQGYTPRFRKGSGKVDLKVWDTPGRVGKPLNINRIYKKEGRAWQADIQSQTLAELYDLPLNEYGVPTDPSLTTAESKLGNLQLLINDAEKQAALTDRENAISQIMQQFQDPAFMELYGQTLNRFENPDPLGDQYYERLRSEGKEQNARALQDQILQIRQGLSGRGLGNSGIRQGLETRANVATSQSNLANNRNIGLQQSLNYTQGLDTAFNQGQDIMDRITNASTQIANLYGSTQYTPSDLSGLAASLNTKLKDYQSGRGFFG